MRKTYIIQITSVLLLLASVLVLTYKPERAKSEPHGSPPTIFVHGYKGTFNSFGNMLKRFENNGWGNKALVYHVSENGRVRDINLNKGKTMPVFIQVIFEDNRASFNDTASWLADVLQHIKEKYKIDTVNIVGHSMGGLITLKYIEEYQNPSLYPVTRKFVAIGSPFDGVYSQYYFQINRDPAATDLKPGSSALELLEANKQAIPENLSVLSIGSTGDKVAMTESVRELRMIIPNNQLQEVMIEDKQLGHSELHENRQVDKIIHSFLWQDGVE